MFSWHSIFSGLWSRLTICFLAILNTNVHSPDNDGQDHQNENNDKHNNHICHSMVSDHLRHSLVNPDELVLDKANFPVCVIKDGVVRCEE